ncbi:type II toxin-antitoxin system YhaV family toxin [Acetobacter okinawensis]|uniref:type II toxin-antitoxin system YhaV family toxin n=1 Tax=Acetobacter okinawensis TaxID=1076594 RepID=UPI001FD04078|nr:type II toxin-antitoxin system YhaV family toxin [Acetobacter okinawensis]
MRTYGAKSDAYKSFKGMLEDCNLPDDWAALCKAASDQAAVDRLKKASPPHL